MGVLKGYYMGLPIVKGYPVEVPIGPEESKAIKGEGQKGLGI